MDVVPVAYGLFAHSPSVGHCGGVMSGGGLVSPVLLIDQSVSLRRVDLSRYFTRYWYLELDFNPVMAFSDGAKIKVVDARISIRK